MANERIVIESDSEIYFVRPPKDQNVVGALLADDINSTGYVFVIPVEKRQIVRKTHSELDKILNAQNLAITPAKIATLTGNLETSVSAGVEIVGPQKLIVGSDF